MSSVSPSRSPTKRQQSVLKHRAVLAAYAAIDPAGGWSEDWAGVWVETGAGQKPRADSPLAAERGRVDQLVLGNLLKMNQERAASSVAEK